MKKVPTNTTKIPPEIILMEALVKGQSKMITDMEKEGQTELVNSDTIPTRIYTENGKQLLEDWGFTFGDVVEGDPLFQYCNLPPGWKREATSHDMHSCIVDERGRKRIGIFYKAAFYDRDANLSIRKRFSYSLDYDSIKEGVAVAHVTDCDVVIHTTVPIPIKDKDKRWVEQDEATLAAAQWLDDNYPGWRSPSMYWD